MTHIQLLVEDRGNQNALRALLEDRYNILLDDALRDADCYVIDEQSLCLYHEPLREHKRECHPTFTPLLLIRRPEPRKQVELPEPAAKDGPPLIDEIVTAPVTKETLYRSVDNLVVRRDQSVALTNQYEQIEARFHALFAAIPDPAFVLNENAILTEMNDAFCSSIGVERSELLGQAIADVQGLGLDEDVTINQIESIKDDQQATNRQLRFTDRNNETRIAKLSVQTVFVEGSRCTVGVLTDITEIQKKNERLEEFANIVAHDVRNPLQVAQARLDFIEETYADEDEHIAAIDRSLDRIEDLIDKLLLVARTGKDHAEITELSIVECAERAWETVETNDATLVTDIEDSVTIRADEKRLIQLFENLFRNAIEHNGDAVTVCVGSLSDGFYVADDGPGISSDVQGEVFQMGKTTNPQGTGLGLSIVREIVNAHSGGITVTESSEGGARFEISDIELSR